MIVLLKSTYYFLLSPTSPYAFVRSQIEKYHKNILGGGAKIFAGILFFSMMFGCDCDTTSNYSPQERQSIDSVVRANSNNIDSLKLLLSEYTQQGNLLGEVLASEELGRRYRVSSMFNEAITIHQFGLKSAQQLGDTSKIVQALNNIATNYRRMGVLDEASTYHYRALTYSELHSNQTYEAKKNRLVSLNGIGNIHLTLNNRELADSIFRQALAGEKELESDLGMAINYANIGSIFESNGLVDSAYYYYQKSMEHNRLAKSNLGISLCHNHFGRLAEQRGAWDEALQEYQSAYDLMENSPDRWHWLESCISLARVNISKGAISSAERYLVLAEATASEIDSWDDLSKVHHLRYLLNRSSGNHMGALEHHIRSIAYSDSVRNKENMSHLQNMRVNYEREKGLRELALAQRNYEIEQRNKRTIIVAAISVLSLAIVALAILIYALRMKSRTQQIMRKIGQVRQNFFTNVTHEFRTPLTVIMGLTKLLRTRMEGTEDRDTLDTILKNGGNLLELVNQLLDISRVNSEVDNPDWKNGNIVAYIEMLVENHRIYARQQLIDLEFSSEESSIEMDFVPSYIYKVMQNLLANAIKFTPRGGHVYAKITKRGSKAVITVADTGVGINAGDMPHIFEPFYQGANSSSDVGTGVGLSLVQQMTEAMGGTVEVESTQGKGATFTLTIPLKHGEDILARWLPTRDTEKTTCEPPLDERAISVGNSEGTQELETVLVVEDNVDVAGYIGALLKNRYHIIFARDGSEGLEKAEEYMPDLILTDLMMPEMDGYELCRRVRASVILNHIPIIIITARSEDSDRIQGLDAGADAYLLKPFNADELDTRMSKLLEQRRMLREKYTNALHEGAEQDVEISSYEKDFLSVLNDTIYIRMSEGNLALDNLADKFCMSQSQMSRKIKSITGLSASTYILQLRMEWARRVLLSTEMPIGEIAEKCGFSDQSHFSRTFRQRFGSTPTQCRQPRKS